MRKELLVLVVLVAVLGFTKSSPAPNLDPDQVISGQTSGFIDMPLHGWADFWWYQDSGQTNDPVEIITLENWKFRVEIDRDNNDNTIFYGKHTTNPHAGETEAQSITYTSVSLWQQTGSLLPPRQSAHPPLEAHYDEFELSWEWDAANNREHLIIEAEHIPEPVTLALLFLSGGLVMLKRTPSP